MKNKERAKRVLDILVKDFSGARIALNFSTPLELLIATILSAQCTDERVNITTKTLFKKYKKAKDYASVSAEELAKDISSINFYNNKTKSIQKCASQLVGDFSGKVPSTLDELVGLAGVGRKTANVVLGNAFNIPALAVDTHVLRVSNRLGLAEAKDPDKVEAELTAVISEERWTDTTRLLILHGRTTCKARKPLCGECKLTKLCLWFKENG
jgi:endonuclease-3